MPLKTYLSIMSAATAFCCLIFIYIVWTVDPETTNGVGFFLFYLSAGMSIIGLSAIAGFAARFVFLRHDLAVNAVKAAFRQSFFFSVSVVACLIMLSKNLLSWLNLSILIIGLSALEFFLLSYESTRNARREWQEGKER